MHVVILVTAKNRKEALKISAGLIKAKLAACVNIINKIDSIFFWAGKVDQTRESLLVIKSRREKMPKIIKLVKALHSYEVPEIIALPIISADQPYLRWIDATIR